MIKHTDIFRNSDIIQHRTAETRVQKLRSSGPILSQCSVSRGLLCAPNPFASDPSSWEAHRVSLSWLRESEPELSSTQREGRLSNASAPAFLGCFLWCLPAAGSPGLAAEVANNICGSWLWMEEWRKKPATGFTAVYGNNVDEFSCCCCCCCRCPCAICEAAAEEQQRVEPFHRLRSPNKIN